MSTFTSSLPDDLLKKLNDMAVKISTPKNKIIEAALKIYLDQLNRAEYIKSYKVAATDESLMDIAEDGMVEYLKMLDE